MENASKALIMAGGVLLGILLISLLLSVYTQMNKTQEESAKIQATKELAEFNAYYESYNKEVVYGAEILTLINKAKETNEDGITINIKVIDVSGNEFESVVDIDAIKNEIIGKKETEYECTEVRYEQGRVNKLTFLEIYKEIL